ncbi:3-hydroxyacyl-CoA dehydrogenase family protein, partial [Thermodesulfobacteriota bacterium]
MKLEDIKCVGIVGAGVMGGGIAQSIILSGTKVILRDLTDEICERAKDTIINSKFGLKVGAERGKHTQQEVDDAIALLNVTTNLEDLKNCDLIIEAIGGGDDGAIENKPMKLKVFEELENIVKKEAIFVTNTSKFTIADLAVATNRKNLFIGGHFFSPANIMKLVEVTSTQDTDEDVTEVLIELSKKWGKVPVRVKDVPGDTGF